MSFCIMRMAKIKSRVSLLRAAQHNTRERMPPNAVKERSSLNVTKGGSVSEVMSRYSDMLPKKVRKNAVHAVELIMTASPDYAKEKKDWARYTFGCSQWVKDLFGEANVLHAAVHFDETTPHCHFLVMPIKDEKLNANHFIGGARDRMAKLQDDFYQKVGRPCGLDRGQSKAETKARHMPHTLALQAAKLDEREEKLAKAEEEVKNAAGMTLKDIQALQKSRDDWDNKSPDEVIQFGKLLKAKGFQTVGEYRRSLEQNKTIAPQQGRARSAP